MQRNVLPQILSMTVSPQLLKHAEKGARYAEQIRQWCLQLPTQKSGHRGLSPLRPNECQPKCGRDALEEKMPAFITKRDAYVLEQNKKKNASTSGYSFDKAVEETLKSQLN